MESTNRTVRTPHGTCGMTIRITPEGAKAPTFYEARPVATDRGSDVVKAFRLTKLGADGLPDARAERYDVALTLDGPECSCPDFTFHREGRDPAGCKHCRTLAALGVF